MYYGNFVHCIIDYIDCLMTIVSQQEVFSADFEFYYLYLGLGIMGGNLSKWQHKQKDSANIVEKSIPKAECFGIWQRVKSEKIN